MVEAEIKAFVQRELPRAITEDPSIRDFVLRTVSEFYAPRTEFAQRLDRVLRVNTLFSQEPRKRVIEIYSFDKFNEKLNAIMLSHFFAAVPQATQLR